MSAEERSVYDERIFQQLCVILKDIKVIGCYVSYGYEADTRRMIDWCLAQHKTVVVPKTLEHTLEFHQLQSIEHLVPGINGILEPSDEPVVPLSEIEVMVVPLSAYDKQGNRTGYGGGYYDSVLKYTRKNIGIGYPVQQVDHIECNPLDVALDAVVSG